MLKSTRKLFSLIASFVFLLCLVPSANATESESVVSFSYFYEALKDEYAKYGVDFEIENPNYNDELSVDFLNEQLEAANNFCKGLTVEYEPAVFEVVDSGVSPASMIRDYYWKSQCTIFSKDMNPAGFLNVTMICSGKVDLQNNHVLTVNPSMREDSATNLAENNLTFDAEATYGGTSVHFFLDGSVKFSWTEPHTYYVFTSNVYGPFAIDYFTPADYTY